METGDEVARLDFFQRRLALPADLGRERAPVLEAAAFGHFVQARHEALDRREARFAHVVEPRDRGEEPAGVGMGGTVEDATKWW